jgi:hypothetical protein
MKLRRFVGGIFIVIAAFILFLNLVLTGSVVSDESAVGDLSLTVVALALLFAGLFLLALSDFKRSNGGSVELKKK